MVVCDGVIQFYESYELSERFFRNVVVYNSPFVGYVFSSLLRFCLNCVNQGVKFFSISTFVGHGTVNISQPDFNPFQCRQFR